MSGINFQSGVKKEVSTYLYSMPNRLINEQSPYLLQHANNPVDWYPWGDEAFNRAKEENMPVLVSIGYSACHWCHVMEHESFEDKETAAYMNEHFVCIKVDREEHPDVDHMYMDAVQAIGGSGGWPLNVFVTPDRAPFYGGTYYPPRPAYNRPSWMQLMQRMDEIWTKQHDEVQQQADQMIKHLQQASVQSVTENVNAPDDSFCKKIAENLLKMADVEQGGFGNAPKFPGTMAITYLLEHHHFTGDEKALSHALKSLDAMIAGGIYDQLNGGFSRYSTDRQWLAPHFEKMLYDNALLVSTLCDAYTITRNEKYKAIAEQTIAFADRELKSESGGYYCALDADSEGEEGKFYTWTWDEWIEALYENDEIAEVYFGIKREGNWEGTNILHVAKSLDAISIEKGMDLHLVEDRIYEAKKKLLKKQSGRVRPGTDDKSLLSWNALMNIALSKASVAFGEEKYSAAAEQHMQWMIDNFMVQGQLNHVWKNGTARITAKLDDHAYLIQAMVTLASASGSNHWIAKANELLEVVVTDFDFDGCMFYYTSKYQQEIPVRKVDVYDGAIPSANAVMAHNLWICGMCMEKSDWVSRSSNMIGQMSDKAMRYAYSFGYWSTLLQRQVAGMKTVILSGQESKEQSVILNENYNPQAFTVTLGNNKFELPILKNKFFGGKLSIFVCSEQACLSPVSSVGEALSLIKKQT